MKCAYVAILAICVLAVVVTADEVTPDSVVDERSVVDSFNDFMETEEQSHLIKGKGKAKTNNAAKTLKHIADLRAYSIAAKDKDDDFQEAHAHADAGLVHFLMSFGTVVYKTPPPPAPSPNLPNNIVGLPVELPNDATMGKANKKEIQGNVVLQYARAMREAYHKFNSGLGTYLLGHLDKKVLAGDKHKVLETFHHAGGNYVGLNYKAVGLTHRPDYFVKLAVPLSKFLTALKSIHAQCKSADAGAATMWLQQGQKKEFKSFLDKEHDKASAIATKSNGLVVKAALQSIRTWYGDRGSYKRLQHVAPARTDGGDTGMGIMSELPGAALRGTGLVKPLDVPSEPAMQKAADQAAKTWVANQSGDLAKKELNKVEEKPVEE